MSIGYVLPADLPQQPGMFGSGVVLSAVGSAVQPHLSYLRRLEESDHIVILVESDGPCQNIRRVVRPCIEGLVPQPNVPANTVFIDPSTKRWIGLNLVSNPVVQAMASAENIARLLENKDILIVMFDSHGHMWPVGYMINGEYVQRHVPDVNHYTQLSRSEMPYWADGVCQESLPVSIYPPVLVISTMGTADIPLYGSFYHLTWDPDDESASIGQALWLLNSHSIRCVIYAGCKRDVSDIDASLYPSVREVPKIDYVC